MFVVRKQETMYKFLNYLLDYISNFVDLFTAIVRILTLGMLYINWDIDFRFWYHRKIIKRMKK